MKTTLLRINTLDGLKVLHLLHIRNHLIQTCQTPDMSKVHLSVNSQHGAMTRPATSTDVEYEREQVRSQMRARAARRVVKHACATGAHRHGRSKHHRCHRARVASQRPARVVSHDRTDAVHACPVKQRVLAYCDGLGSEHRRQSRGGRLRERAGIYTATPRCPNFSFL